MSALTFVLGQTPTGTIEDVVARMTAIEEALPPADGIACFNKLYLEVTKNVLENLANLYFGALRAFDAGSPDTPRAWKPLFEARDATTIAPIQFALNRLA